MSDEATDPVAEAPAEEKPKKRGVGRPQGGRAYDWDRLEQEWVIGQDQTVAEFCRKRGIPYDSARQHSSRRDWIAKRDAYREQLKTDETQKILDELETGKLSLADLRTQTSRRAYVALKVALEKGALSGAEKARVAQLLISYAPPFEKQEADPEAPLNDEQVEELRATANRIINLRDDSIADILAAAPRPEGSAAHSQD